MFADLHLHTNFSDGTYSPEQLAAQAARARLKAIAVTDHDTIEGCARVGAACQEHGIEFIPAAELTAEMNDHELHILGFYLDTANPLLLARLAECQRVRQERIRQMVARINEMGIPLAVDDVFALANCRSPGRPHVARTLWEREFVSSIDEALERFLKKGKPAWVPKLKMSAQEAIDLIHQAGGLAVLAHPGLTRADELIPELAAQGLDGLECFHTKHSRGMAENYLALATRLNLLVTGGFDCHGTAKSKPLIGTGKFPYPYLQRLQNPLNQPAPHPRSFLARTNG